MTKKSSLSPEDLALFHSEMQHVTPLKSKKPKIPNERLMTPPLPTRSKQPEPLQEENYTGWDLSDYYANPVQSESLLIYHQPGIGKQQLHALKTGNLTYQAKLDLHGLKPDAAKERLCQFLRQKIQQQQRWVLIIHGKGGRFGEAPILKNLVNLWLRQIPIVLAFHSAHPKHGGPGAIYVLLKK
ncbi:MAG: Smr/MutS family protein [Gammaproteobacteria bacterium]